MSRRNAVSAAAPIVALAGLLSAAWPAATVRGETSSSKYQLSASSSDSILWLVAGEWDPQEKTFLNWLAFMDKASPEVRATAGVRVQTGEIARCAVIDQSLHIFFENGFHYRYTRSIGRRELRLPGPVVPEAIAGESKDGLPQLWAVVNSDTAAAVATEWEKTRKLRTTQPAGEIPSKESRNHAQTAPTIGALSTDAYQLVQYTGSDWKPGFAAPDEAASSERLWLCVAGDRHHLFWQKTKQKNEINYAWYENGHWSTDPTLVIPLTAPPHEAQAVVINTQLFFLALIPDHRVPHQLRCESWLRQSAPTESGKPSWVELPAPTDAGGKTLLIPAGSAITACFDNRLAVLRMGDKQPEVGFWPLTRGGAPDQPFRPVPLRRKADEPGTPRGIREFATTLIVAAILLLVFWRRQGSFASPLPLPGGLRITRPGKRAMAAVIDLIPAALVVGWWWRVPLIEFMNEVNAFSGAPEQIPEPPDELVLAWVWFRILYTSYCLAFEMAWARTPGKWLLRCIVLSESIARPNALQIAIRNLTRLIEFEPFLMIWPFMLVIFFTRNRQRIGDLLARTVVVERDLSVPLGTDEDRV